MLWSVDGVRGFQVQAADGPIGRVSDLLFEDRTSAVRYLVVDTGGWLSSRKMLLTPEVLRRPDTGERLFPIALTRAQVKDSPEFAADRPVSRRYEAALHAHYGWQPYWDEPMSGGPGAAGGGSASIAYWGRMHGERIAAAIDPERADAGAGETAGGDPRLRSAREVIGYDVEATDGEIGHVEDLLAEDGSWIVRYLVVDTRNWWPGKKVLVAPEWLNRVDWADKRVGVDLMRERIKAAPEYTSPAEVDRDFEQRLYRHYGQSPYESPAPG